jgi:hypothetical protein
MSTPLYPLFVSLQGRGCMWSAASEAAARIRVIARPRGILAQPSAEERKGKVFLR